MSRDLDALIDTPTGRTDRLGARVLAEGVGTGLLVCAVVGSGIAAQRLSPGQVGLQLLENALATGAALAVLIAVLQPVSAAFNPAVTILERATGAIGTRQAVASITAQLVGGIAGAALANLMFGQPAVTVATTDRSGPGLWLGRDRGHRRTHVDDHQPEPHRPHPPPPVGGRRLPGPEGARITGGCTGPVDDARLVACPARRSSPTASTGSPASIYFLRSMLRNSLPGRRSRRRIAQRLHNCAT